MIYLIHDLSWEPNSEPFVSNSCLKLFARAFRLNEANFDWSIFNEHTNLDNIYQLVRDGNWLVVKIQNSVENGTHYVNFQVLPRDFESAVWR